MQEIILKPFSVLISFYSGSKPEELDEALKSVWYKQLYRPSQICLVQDGEITPRLEAVVEKWLNIEKLNLTLIKIKDNIGLARALNYGLQHCSYDLVARMDADDVSTSQRFKIQFEYMQSHPEIGVMGGQVAEYDDSLSRVLSYRYVPLSNSDIVKFSKLRSPFNHPTVMFRKEIIVRLKGYPSIFPEDYALWVHLIQNGIKLANTKQVLVKMRAESALRNRRGVYFFIRELHLIRYFMRIGFFSLHDAFRAFYLRAIYRILPYTIKVCIRKKLRKNLLF